MSQDPREGSEGPGGPLGGVLRTRNGHLDVSPVLCHPEPGISQTSGGVVSGGAPRNAVISWQSGQRPKHTSLPARLAKFTHSPQWS